MRPLAVLILVLGAAAALLFAVTSLTGSGERSAEAAGPTVVKPATARPTPAAQVDPVATPDFPTEEVPKTADREIVATESGQAAPGSYANWLEGVVRDEQGVPIANAQVQLFERKVVSQFADVLR